MSVLEKFGVLEHEVLDLRTQLASYASSAALWFGSLPRQTACVPERLLVPRFLK